MITVRPVRVEAVNEDGTVLFAVTAFDEKGASIEIKTPLESWNVHEMTDAMQKAFDLLEMK